MKRFSILLMVAALIILAAPACSKKKNHPYFHGIVIEVKENYVLIEPDAGTEESKSADQIAVSLNMISKHQVPKMEPGTAIRVAYNGKIAESYPAQINEVFAIYLIDDDGNLIEETD